MATSQTDRSTTQYLYMDDWVNMLNIGIRRRSEMEVVAALVSMRRDNIPVATVRRALLRAVAGNIGLANPLLLIAIGQLDWQSEDVANPEGEVSLEAECRASALLVGNVCLSLHVQLFTDLCSLLLSHKPLCNVLYGQSLSQLSRVAVSRVDRAIASCTANDVKEACIYFAYLVFAEPDTLSANLEANFMARRHNYGPRWCIVLTFLFDELRSEPAAALFVLAFLLLLTRDELVIGPWRAPAKDERARARIDDFALRVAEGKIGDLTFPNCIYDITTETGRIENRTCDEYFTQSLRLVVKCTVWPNCLDWLPDQHRRIVEHYFAACLGIQHSAYNSSSRKVLSTANKLAEATRGENNAVIKKLRGQLQEEELKKAQAGATPTYYANCPLMFSPEAIKANLADLRRIAAHYGADGKPRGSGSVSVSVSSSANAHTNTNTNTRNKRH